MDSNPPFPAQRESLLSILGVVYIHRKTSDGGDIYLTQFGLPWAPQLEIQNWHEKEWFDTHRQQLRGTGFVYRIPTKPVDGKSAELVYKNCRVGEHVPVDTHTLLEYLNTEFNSPWEEFALVLEMREGRWGPPEIQIKTQEPLAIYVPPEPMQLWQSGRSLDKIDQIKARHPGIDLDILRQYKLVYGWIQGKDLVEVLQEIGVADQELEARLKPITKKAMGDMMAKGFVMTDMKPSHIIIGEDQRRAVVEIGAGSETGAREKQLELVHGLIEQGSYSVIDYELVLRTPQHEEEVKQVRRHLYLDDQRNRFVPSPLPPHLESVEILGVPYIHGRVESTGGQLWVVGRNANLFDYFLPERWRKTAAWKLSENSDVFYTVTKDNIHIVWRASRVGELPPGGPDDERHRRIREIGFNSPFEAFALAQFLGQSGVPVIYMRAIYETGYDKLAQPADPRRYELLREVVDAEGRPILRRNCNYISIRGYYNGPDSWVAAQEGELYRPIDLDHAVLMKIITPEERQRLLDALKQQLKDLGYDGSLLEGDDLLLALDPAGELVKDRQGSPEARICNFELIGKG